MPVVEQECLFRYASRFDVEAERVHRYSTTDVEAERLHRYSSMAAVEAERVHRYASAPALVAGVSPWDLAWKVGLGEMDITILVHTPAGTRDISSLPYALDITLEESQLMQWELSLVDPTGFYNPRKVGGAWEGVMDADAYDASDNFIKWVTFEITWGGMTQTFYGIPKKFGWKRTAPGRLEFKWSGSCPADKLFRQARTAPTLRTTSSGAQIFNDTALQDIFTRANLNSDISRVRRQPVRLQQRQNDTWAAYLTELLEACPWAEWYCQGDTVVCYQPARGGRPHWVYDVECVVPEEDYEQAAPDAVTQVTVRRAVEGSKTTSQEVNAFGSGYSQTFSPPANAVQYAVTTNGGGVMSDVIYRNSAGEVMAVRDVRGGVWPPLFGAASANGVAKVDFTWGAPVGSSATGAYGVVEWTRADDDREDTFGSKWDPVFNVTVDDSELQARFGVRKKELSPNPLLVSSSHAQEYGEGYLRRIRRELDPQNLRVPFNHMIFPGQYYQLVDTQLGQSETRYITRVTHSLRGGPEDSITRIRGVIY